VCLEACLEDAEAAFPPICRSEVMRYYDCSLSVPYWRCIDKPLATETFSCIPQSGAMNSCLDANQ
jgi:hypothetical protein